ncbi:UAA transporter family-domain-containing protein [Mycena galericulata]|nr:UAA transporter family-domain-containing protein [Mycena galericulata]
MVMGGCCVNVWAYEQLLNMNARIGLPEFLVFHPGHRLTPFQAAQVPLTHWAAQVLLLTTGSLLNNWAFAYKVPLTVLIVFRSAGLAVSMFFGFLFAGRRYTLMQVVSVLLVSAGVALATLARPSPAAAANRHFLSLPVFLFLVRDVQQGLRSLSESTNDSSAMGSWLILGLKLMLPTRLRLGREQTLISEAISLCFSVWWFGNEWNAELGIGRLSGPKKVDKRD